MVSLVKSSDIDRVVLSCLLFVYVTNHMLAVRMAVFRMGVVFTVSYLIVLVKHFDFLRKLFLDVINKLLASTSSIGCLKLS